MRFGLSEEQLQLQESVDRFLSDRIPLDAVRRFANGDNDDRDTWAGLAELGIAGLLVPDSAGGVGLGGLDTVVVAERLGYHAAPTPYLGTAVMAPIAFSAAGTHADLLGAIASGERRVGIAFGEAIGRRADAGISVRARRLNGKALFAFDDSADDYLVATAERHLYLVTATTTGVARRPLTTVDKTRTTCELVFDNVQAALISDDPDVFTRTLDAGRVALAGDTLGAAQYMLDQAVAYALQRKQFNRVIGSFQAVKHMCADMVANLEPCRSLVWYAGHALDHVPEERRMIACQAKAHVSDVGRMVAKTATEVHGGMGFTELLGLHYWFKRIGANHQWLGAPELLREEAARVQGLVVAP
jgi:alkylation response protein AidB-like acyl-CoA dehydrogenase